MPYSAPSHPGRLQLSPAAYGDRGPVAHGAPCPARLLRTKFEEHGVSPVAAIST